MLLSPLLKLSAIKGCLAHIEIHEKYNCLGNKMRYCCLGDKIWSLSYKRPPTFKLELGNGKPNIKNRISPTSLIHLVTRSNFILKLDSLF